MVEAKREMPMASLWRSSAGESPKSVVFCVQGLLDLATDTAGVAMQPALACVFRPILCEVCFNQARPMGLQIWPT